LFISVCRLLEQRIKFLVEECGMDPPDPGLIDLDIEEPPGGEGRYMEDEEQSVDSGIQSELNNKIAILKIRS
jgi:hypothetical protein